MTTRNALLSLIGVTTAALAFPYAASQAYLFAALAVALGSSWIYLEIRGAQPLGSAFFVAFILLSLGAVFNLAPTPLILLTVTTNLAAWDLSRFRSRIAEEDAQEKETALLEATHLRKLALTAGAGFVIALVPLLIQFSVNFIVLLLLILLTMIALRRSMLTLRGGNSGGTSGS